MAVPRLLVITSESVVSGKQFEILLHHQSGDTMQKKRYPPTSDKLASKKIEVKKKTHFVNDKSLITMKDIKSKICAVQANSRSGTEW